LLVKAAEGGKIADSGVPAACFDSRTGTVAHFLVRATRACYNPCLVTALKTVPKEILVWQRSG